MPTSRFSLHGRDAERDRLSLSWLGGARLKFELLLADSAVFPEPFVGPSRPPLSLRAVGRRMVLDKEESEYRHEPGGST